MIDSSGMVQHLASTTSLGNALDELSGILSSHDKPVWFLNNQVIAILRFKFVA